MRPSLLLPLLSLSTLRCLEAAPIHSQTPLQSHLQSAEEIRSALKKSSIISDVLDDFTPSLSITLYYPKTHTTVSLGNTFPPSNVSSSPDLYISDLSTPATLSPTRTFAANKTFALVLSDPDATSRADPTMGQMCHWIVQVTLKSSENETEGLEVGVMDGAYTLHFGSGIEAATENKPKELMEYLAPAPPKGTGKHRYVFVLLEKEGTGNLKVPKERPHWGYGKRGKGVREWAEDNDLSVVAANFFYSEKKKD